MMKKYMVYIVMTGMIVSLCACGKKLPETVHEEETKDIYEEVTQTESVSEPETIPLIQSTVQPNERTTHNENDIEKDRLLAFLNNEVPVVEYPLGEPGVSLYYGDICDEVSEEKQDEPCYGIMDVTGNGENEYIFYNGNTAVCMTYDEEKEQFGCLLFSDTVDTFFLGKGQVMSYHPGETNIYTYSVYDERGGLTESRQFAITLTETPVITIDGEPVTEDTWKEEFDWIMDLYHTRPEIITFEELLK